MSSHPIAHPPAWSEPSQSTWPDHPSHDSVAPSHARTMRPSSPRPVGPLVLERLRSSLSARDLAIVRTVEQLRFLTALQLEALHFEGHASTTTAARACRRTLERLFRQRVLVRLERRIGGLRAGSASFVYALGPVGERLVRSDLNLATRRRFREPSVTFLDHTLAISQLVVQLTRGQGPGLELLKLEPEPTSWRPYQDGHGTPRTLKPDLGVVLRCGDYDDHWFIEVDRSTASLPAVIVKCQQYLSYYKTGIEQHQTGVFPRVLWIAPTTKRAQAIERSISEASLPADLFSVTTTDDALSLLQNHEEGSR